MYNVHLKIGKVALFVERRLLKSERVRDVVDDFYIVIYTLIGFLRRWIST